MKIESRFEIGSKAFTIFPTSSPPVYEFEVRGFIVDEKGMLWLLQEEMGGIAFSDSAVLESACFVSSGGAWARVPTIIPVLRPE